MGPLPTSIHLNPFSVVSAAAMAPAVVEVVVVASAAGLVFIAIVVDTPGAASICLDGGTDKAASNGLVVLVVDAVVVLSVPHRLVKHRCVSKTSSSSSPVSHTNSVGKSTTAAVPCDASLASSEVDVVDSLLAWSPKTNGLAVVDDPLPKAKLVVVVDAVPKEKPVEDPKPPPVEAGAEKASANPL